ncbi:MAG: hypothetical protein BM557_05335 [Flavobacterium sp. MedPE-SWcel]|uniref:hypothetical protein n=1 Tax=uncultured Flavobacterium sp. TaxID=165435 RepID=UPI00090ED967|nr:hypothetical protein [uncultured Flavobacterium sp.]OIQ20096.1 MAG: hypothetical protein BM557_05335 [Flavobacterium sp. MedPE-SWcel]
METYNCFGYHYANHQAQLEISLPNEVYDYEYCNISSNNWNGLVISLKKNQNDTGAGLDNPNMDFQTLLVDLTKVPKLTGEVINDYDHTKPTIVFIYHNKDVSEYHANNVFCHKELSNRNVIDALILKEICGAVAGPAKAGVGSLRRV